MPRRANLAVATQSRPAPQRDLRAENLVILRKQWRWAAFSQFFYTFFPLFALTDVSVADIEQDLVGSTTHVLPRIMQKLLYSLSYDRKVSVDNWQTALRKQYKRRSPHANPIGPEPSALLLEDDVMEQETKPIQTDDKNDKDDSTVVSQTQNSTVRPVEDFSSAPPALGSTRQSSVVEENRAHNALKEIDDGHDLQEKSIDWFDLPMLAKLESMHTVAEWQFHNPTRLKTIMKSEDEFATWRIEPIGYDSKGNAYWLIGADRLWIQRSPPKPKFLKRKNPPQKAPKKGSISSVQNTKRIRLTLSNKSSAANSTPLSDRHSRAAKDRANTRLGAQAKELAEFNRNASYSGSRRQAPMISLADTVVGTRSSARLRGTQSDEWQSIPDEWLQDVQQSQLPRVEAKTGLESDDDSASELTDLSDDSLDASSVSLKPEVNEHQDNLDQASAEEHSPLNNFVEWEMICSTLPEWERIAGQFEKASHYSEKALYKLLVKDIVPVIIQEMKETERKRQLEAAVVHRKRSSRIALRESEKEMVRMASVRKQEDKEKMSRARRLEIRKQREEEGRIKKESSMELKRRERESVQDDEGTDEAVSSDKRRSTTPASESQQTNLQRTIELDVGIDSRTSEDWELACEICNRQGINCDDHTPMMSCGSCSKWQHIQCHDNADRLAGRPLRNWNSEDFICSRCLATRRVQYNDYNQPTSKGRQPEPPAATPAHLNTPSSSSNTQDHNSSTHYLPGYNNPLQQNHYGRPNGSQYPNAQYPSVLGPPSALSFSHYQPSNKISPPNIQSTYTYPNISNGTLQQRRYDLQNSTWSPTVNSMHPTPTLYNMPSQPNNPNIRPVHAYSIHEPHTSYTKYSTDSRHKQPVPYQRQ